MVKIKDWIEKIKHNHLVMMILCCGIPLLVIYSLGYFFDLDRRYTFWSFLVICGLMHYFMMKHMHGDHKDKKEKGGCH
ncbi:MAG TPA: DUF2933 domain-containing protein [Candidatus Nanoarchaeia archaeon]|nr:DUF2933 domain-containing protein [Candidatus Nanoarchaeia archaeon]